MNSLIGHSKQITGVIVSYYFICKRKLWLFARNIQLENENEEVLIGRQIHEQSYKREKKNITILDAINVDFLHKKDKLILNEIKKSSINEEADYYQLLFYLYFLDQYGIKAEGVIRYPMENKKKKIILTEEKKEEIQKIENNIKDLIHKSIPQFKRTKNCSKCAYKDFCLVV